MTELSTRIAMTTMARETINREAPSFPAGMQFAEIMIEDKTYSSSNEKGKGRPESVCSIVPLLFYKPISRYLNPDLL